MNLIIMIARWPALFRHLSRIIWGRRYKRLATELIDGEYRHANNFSHSMPFGEKFKAIRCEFAGSNELCFEIVKRIIRIRRSKRAAANWLFVLGAILNYPDQVYPKLTTRWIVSVLDTISDMPCPRDYKLAAGMIRNFLLGVRLGHSMAVQSVVNPEIRGEPIHFFINEEIWDGVIHFNYRYGDTYRNLFGRVHREIGHIPSLYLAWQTILTRMTILGPYRTAFLANEKSRAVFHDLINPLNPE